MATNRDTRKLAVFSGLQDKNPDTEVGFKGLMVANNVDITRNLKIRRRTGQTQVLATSVDAAWSSDDLMLLLSSGTLKSFDGAAATNIRTGLTPTRQLAAYQLGENVYYSNGVETGVVDVLSKTSRTLGLETPPRPVLAATSGTLPEGLYQVTTTFVRDDDQESGAALGSEITLTAQGGIAVTVPVSSDPTVVSVNIWATHPNGTEFYLAGRVTNGNSSFVLPGSIRQLTIPLRSQFLSAPPGFTEIEYHGSRMLYGTGRALVYSEPFMYEATDLRFNFIPFTAGITMIASVETGFFVGTSKEVFFFAGADVKDTRSRRALNVGAVKGTKVYVQGNLVGKGDIKEMLPMFLTKNGVCYGLPDGSIQNVTERSVDISAGLYGTAMFREQNEQNHYVAVLKT